MIKFKSIIFIGLMLCMHQAFSQNVVVSMGGDIVGATGSVSYSVGQPADISIYDTAVTVNTRTAAFMEGVQQSYFLWEQVDIPQVASLNVNISIYPNPTVDGFTVQISDMVESMTYILYSINGQILQEGVLENNKRIDMHPYAEGSYLLRIRTQDNQHENSYKIIKGY